jgi:hypothetical protein
MLRKQSVYCYKNPALRGNYFKSESGFLIGKGIKGITGT